MFNLRSVDLNLLPVFEAAYEERSLSRAAGRLAMTQSAVSHALTRLRALFRDELFVRQSRGVVPTPAADRVYEKLHRGLMLVREAVTDRRGFDPKTSERHFFIAIPHPLGPMMALRLHDRLGEIAPRVLVDASTRSRPIDLERSLREGRIDAAIDWLPIDGAQFKQSILFQDTLVAIAQRGHPALRRAGGLRDTRVLHGRESFRPVRADPAQHGGGCPRNLRIGGSGLGAKERAGADQAHLARKPRQRSRACLPACAACACRKRSRALKGSQLRRTSNTEHGRSPGISSAHASNASFASLPASSSL